MQLNNERIQ